MTSRGPIILSLKEIGRSFGGIQALSGIDIDVFHTEIVGLIGPNGSGKTTLFNLVSGFYRPDRGAIFFKGRDLSGLRADQICQIGISRAFQIVRPFIGLSVFQNVLIGSYNRARNRREAYRRCLKTLELTGLDKMKDQSARNLTLPDKKRLEMAKALSTDPEILLLDEVMAGLTPLETQDIMTLIRTINEKGVTIIAIEHVMEAIMSLSDRIVVLNYGRKIAEGTADEIANNAAVIEVYLGEAEQTA